MIKVKYSFICLKIINHLYIYLGCLPHLLVKRISSNYFFAKIKFYSDQKRFSPF